MSEKEERASWPLSDVAAAQINRLRKRAGLTREQLAERCRELGAPEQMSAAALANIETGRRNPQTGQRRRDLTIEEIALFAAALRVPPVLLFIPVGVVDLLEVLPGRSVTPWEAYEWIIGRGPLVTRQTATEQTHVTEDDHAAWETGSVPIGMAAEHHSAQEWLRRTLELGESDHRGTRLLAELRLARSRRAMRQAGLKTPQLDESLAYVDQDRFIEESVEQLRRRAEEQRGPNDLMVQFPGLGEDGIFPLSEAGEELAEIARQQEREKRGAHGSTEDQTDPGR